MNRDKLIKNEQVVRNRNRTFGAALKRYFGGKDEITQTPLEFVCECSDIKCEEPIKVSIEEYEKLHKRRNRFLVVKGHKLPQIEKTVVKKGNMELVEKPDLNP